MTPDADAPSPSALRSDAGVLELVVAAACFAVAQLAFYSGPLLDGRILGPGDGATFFYPAYLAPRTAWTETLFAGYPVSGDPQMFYAYPVALLMRAVHAPYDLFLLLGPILACTFAYAIVRDRTGDRFAAVVAGLTFGFSEFLVVHLTHASWVHAAAWLAAAVWCAERYARTKSLRWLFAYSVSIALLALCGAPQLFVYGGTVIAAHAFLVAGSSDASVRRALVVGALAGLALGAPGLLPAAELSRESVRQALTFAEFNSNSMRGREVATLLFPRAFGGYGFPFDTSDSDLQAYVGLFVLALALVGASEKGARFFAGLAVVSLVLSLRTPALQSLVFRLPIYGLLRGPTRHLFEFAFAMSVLAGLGLAAVRKKPTALLPAAGVIALAVLVLLPVILGSPRMFPMPEEYRRLSNPALYVPVLLAAATVVLALAARRLSPRALGVACVLLAAADLASCARFQAWRDSGPPPPSEPPPALAQLRDSLRSTGHRAFALDGYWDRNVTGDFWRLWDLPTLSGYSVLNTQRYRELAEISGNGKALNRAALLSNENQVLDVLGARFLLVSHEDSAGVQGPRFRTVGELGGEALVENLRVLPRAWLVERSRALAPAKVMEALRTSRIDGAPFAAHTEALLEDGSAAASWATGIVTVESITPEEVVLRVDAEGPALAVSSDIFFPGWTATVDGNAVPVLRADAVLRAVQVPGGTHRVEFRFRPRAYQAGLGLAGLALIGFGVAGIRRRRGST